MQYLVQGYVFIALYLFITKDAPERTKYSLLLPSIAASYILKVVYDKSIIALLKNWINIKNDSGWYFIGLLLFSLVLAYICGQLVLFKPFQKLLLELKFPRTVNASFWADMFTKGMWFNIFIKGHKFHYLGQVSTIEEGTQTPYIELVNYSLYDCQTEEELDCTTEDGGKHSIILHLSDIEYIEKIEMPIIKSK